MIVNNASYASDGHILIQYVRRFFDVFIEVNVKLLCALPAALQY